MQRLMEVIQENNEAVADRALKRVQSDYDRRRDADEKAERELREKYAKAIAKQDRAAALNLRRKLGASPDPTLTIENIVDRDLEAVCHFDAAVASLKARMTASVEDRAYACAREQALAADQERMDNARSASKQITILHANVSGARGFLGPQVVKTLAELDSADRAAVEVAKAKMLERFDFIPVDGGAVPVRKNRKARA